jgi:hypothetical protein
MNSRPPFAVKPFAGLTNSTVARPDGHESVLRPVLASTGALTSLRES